MPPRLSEELLAKIIGLLELPTAYTIAELKANDPNAYCGLRSDVRTLCNISQASRALQRIAEPVLYKVFPGSLDGYVNRRLYTAALLAHPGRAELVKEFVLDDHEIYPGLPPVWNPWHTTYNQSWTYEPYHTKSSDWNVVLEEGFVKALPQLHRMIRRMTVIEAFSKFFIEQVNEGHPDAVLAALILSCGGLESMDITISGGYFAASVVARAMFNPIDIASGLPHCNQHSPPDMREVFNLYGDRLPNLHNLSVRGKPNVYVNVGPLMSLSQLRTLIMARIHGVGCMAHDRLSMTGGRNVSALSWPGISAIHLKQCSFNVRELPQILQFAPALRTLEITLGTIEPFFRHGSCGDALRNAGQKLEHLTLDSRRVGWGITYPANSGNTYGYEETLSELVGSLKELKSLKTLSANERFLTGPTRTTCFSQRPQPAVIEYETARLVDVLPDHLEELTLLGSLEAEDGHILGRHATEEVEQLLDLRPFAQLRSVRISGHENRINNIDHLCWELSGELDGDEIEYRYSRKVLPGMSNAEV